MPTGGDGPLCCGVDGGNALTHLLYERLDVVAQDEEVDEVNHQLTEDDGKLVPRDEHASDVRGSHLADVHRADGRGQTYADTTDDAVDVEHDEQRVGGFAVVEEQELWIHRAEGRDEEEDTCDDERLLTAEVRGEET